MCETNDNLSLQVELFNFENSRISMRAKKKHNTQSQFKSIGRASEPEGENERRREIIMALAGEGNDTLVPVCFCWMSSCMTSVYIRS